MIIENYTEQSKLNRSKLIEVAFYAAYFNLKGKTSGLSGEDFKKAVNGNTEQMSDEQLLEEFKKVFGG